MQANIDEWFVNLFVAWRTHKGSPIPEHALHAGQHRPNVPVLPPVVCQPLRGKRERGS